MNHEQLQTFSVTLNALRQTTLDKMRDSMGGLVGEEILPPDIADRAVMESDRNFVLLMRERDRKALAGIQDALARLAAGEYGICDECGEDIAEARLKAQPMATLCVHCQSGREDEARARAGLASGFFGA